jgi:dipeptidyl aminopeptidase/acylaminoacyl peptidase
MRFAGKTLSTIACLTLCTLPVAQAQVKPAPLPIEDVLQASFFPGHVPISLSPDGQWVAFTLKHSGTVLNPDEPRYSRITASGVPSELSRSDIWIASTRTGELRNLTGGEGTNWSPVWSPDGGSLAFYSDRGSKAQLWLWDQRSDNVRLVSDAVVTSSVLSAAAQWTPDGKRVVVRALPEGMDVEDLLDLFYGAKAEPLHVSNDKGRSAEVLVSKSTSQSDHGHSSVSKDPLFDLLLSDLATIDISTGSVRRIAHAVRPYSFVVSPNGSYVAVMSYTHHASVTEELPLCELSLASLERGDVRVVASDLRWNFIPPSWSPDGRSLVYGTVSREGQNDVFLFHIDKKEARRLTLPPDFGTLVRWCPWVWERNGQSVLFISQNALWKIVADRWLLSKIASTEDESFVALLGTTGGFLPLFPTKEPVAIVLVRDERTLREGFWKVDLTTGKSTKLLDEAKVHDASRLDGVRNGIEVAVDGGTIAYLAEDAQHPQDVWTLSSEGGGPRRVTDVNSKLTQYRLGESRLIAWKSLDGQALKGSLVLPAGYREGTLYPLVVHVYGGASLSTTLNQWGGGPGELNMQLLASRGYAVLLPDAPQHVGTPMRDLGETVLPGVQRIIDLGIADPERLGIMGHSYGGYSTLAIIEQSKRFKAAIDFAGITNLLNSYSKLGSAGGISFVEDGQGLMGGSPWQLRDRFIENSPFFYFDRIETPLLIIHGDADEAVSVMESRIAFGALQRLGKDVVFAEYKGGGHDPSAWSYANQLDYYRRVIEWFDRSLQSNSRLHDSPPSQPPTRY